MDSYRFFEGGALPTSYTEVCGTEAKYTEESGTVEFKTGFRHWLRYERLRDLDLPDEEKLALAASAVVERSSLLLPPEAVLRGMDWFYSCGDSRRMEELDIPPNVWRKLNAEKPSSSRYWDFKLLWGSFMQQHNIDLYKVEDIHWWEFVRLAKALKTDTPLVGMQQFREQTRDDFKGTDGKMTAQGRKLWEKTKALQIINALPGIEADGLSDE